MSSRYKNLKLGFVGNKDNIATHYHECLSSNGIPSDIFLTDEDIVDPRSNPDYVGKHFDFTKINEDPLKISRHLKKRLNQYNVLIVSGTNGPLIGSQLDTNLCYVPVGAAEIAKFARSKPFSLFDTKNHDSLIAQIRYLRRIRHFKSKLKSIASIYTEQIGLSECTAMSEQAFPRVKKLEAPKPRPRFEFLREHYDKALFTELHKKYAHFPLLLFVPSRKWIVPDISTGYTKHTEWVLNVLSSLHENKKLSKTSHKIIWLDHGPDSEYCKEFLRKSGLIEFVDFYPHLDSNQLWAFFKLDNLVVLDEFGEECWPVLGGVMREALAFEKMVFTSNFCPESEPYKTAYEKAPVIYCETEEKLTEKLFHLLSDSGEIIQHYSTQIREWEQRFAPSKRFFREITNLIDYTNSDPS